MSYRAAYFLWDGEGTDEDDENGILAVPKTDEEAEFKRIFEDTAGPEFFRFAHGSEDILARRMFRVPQSGISSSRELEKAKP